MIDARSQLEFDVIHADVAVAKESNQDKTLLIFDQVGKQVKWPQYYLEEYGFEN